jgi:5,6,7,8-tetrahydromethanopterin hydro-lyase
MPPQGRTTSTITGGHKVSLIKRLFPSFNFSSEDTIVAKIDKLLIGEALAGEGNEVAHIDLILGPRGSTAESAFANALVNNKDGFTALLAVVAPNLAVKPNTILYNKVTIKNGKQAVQIFGPAQRGVALAVADSVEDGTIPANEADDIFISVGVFIHWLAEDDAKIQDYNYEATRLAIKRAVTGEPKVAEVLAKKTTTDHPFQAHK